MRSHLTEWPARIALGLLSALGLVLPVANAQEPTARADAAAVVEGVVREVFRSPRRGRTDVLVQIDVHRSEGGKISRGGSRVISPAPGESLYVHVIQAANAQGRIPAELSQVRAYLVPRGQGGWEGTFPDWFDLTSDRPVARGPGEPPAADEPAQNQAPTTPTTSSSSPAAPGGKTILQGLGLTVDPLELKGRLAFRATGVERGGPAQRAGIEIGDIIAGANGSPLSGASQLDDLARRGGPITLNVVDINTGKTVPVEVTTVAASPTRKPDADPGQPRDPEPTPVPASPARSLGISTETVSVGGRSALKVIRVTPESPGARAGLEVGDVLVGANGAAITGPEQLAAALHKSGPTLMLQVRDVRTGKDTPVEVKFGGLERPTPPAVPGGRTPAPGPDPGGATNRLGVVTELTFLDIELAVKVTEVEPGGPAARAGIQLGTIIVKADGKSMLHPNDLIEAARKATNSIKLTIADPRNGQKSDLDVDLRGR